MKTKRQLIYSVTLIITLIFALTNSAFSQTYISEIDFQDNEFIEVYSDVNTYTNDTNLNLSNNFLYDDAGIEKANILKLIKSAQSPFILIVGANFINNYNITKLNCTVYSTQKTNIGYYGLKSTGENITIQINQTNNLTWIKQVDLTFQINETLNYNQSKQKYFITESNPCDLPKIETPQQENQTNITEANSTTSQNISTTQNIETIQNNCNQFYFKINPYQNFTTNKIEYNFETNVTNFTIEYWIEDFLGKIARTKTTTTNKNKKTYTPKSYTEIFKIKAIINFQNNCTLHDTKEIIYYNQYKQQEQTTCSQSSSTSATSTSTTSNTQKKSYIKILNQQDIQNSKTTQLQYEVYKGDTQKRTTYIYLNKNKITSFELEKYSKTKGKIELQLEEGLNTITIEGLDKKEEFQIYKNHSNKNQTEIIKPNQKSSKIQINNFKKHTSQIEFNLSTQLENQTISCYINYIKTKISNIENSNISQNSKHITLQINNTKLQEKEKIENYPLKLYCKYKTINKTYYNYISTSFNYTIPNTIPSIKTITTGNYKNNINQIKSNNIKNYNIENQSIKEYLLLQREDKYTPTLLEKEEIIYQSSSLKQKEKSYYTTFIAMSIIFVGFIFIW